MKKNKNLILGLAVFICSIAFLLFAAAPAQSLLGLLGLGITEIGLLVIALAGGLLLKGGFRETFPLKLPQFKEFRGSAYIYISVYGFTIGVSNILLYIFPGMNEVNNALTEFFSEGGLLLIVTASLLPGICEESLFRGTIRSAFRRVENTAAIVLIVGVLFGIFHLDVYRFLPTMILGMGFTYIMVKTENLLYSMFFHALHNLIGILPILLVGAADMRAAPGMNAVTLSGIVIVCFAIGLLFLRLGIRRLNGKNAGGAGKVKRIVFYIACITILLIGFMASGVGAGQAVFETNIAMTLTEEFNDVQHFEVTTAGSYRIEIYVEGDGAIGEARLVNERGEEVYFPESGSKFNVNTYVYLDKGQYSCHVTLTPIQSGDSTEVKIGVLIK